MIRKNEVGHNFLARLGKTRLRPGGKKATEWLIKNGSFSKDKKILEVACNICTTAIGLAKQYGCYITGIDLDRMVLEKAAQNVEANGVSHLIELMHGNALRLPFDDASFDIVLNEAMLTMLPLELKERAVSEYFRVLKPGGVLLTHDVILNDLQNREAILQDLHDAIRIKATPLSQDEWIGLFKQGGFQKVDTISGEMSLLSPTGLIDDEGILGAIKIVRNALRTENYKIFQKMVRLFNSPEKKLGFIAVCSQK